MGPEFRIVVENTGLAALQPAEHRVFRGIADMPLLRHRVDEAEQLGPARVDGFAGQHQRHRLHRVDEPREARGAAETGVQAEHHFRKTKAGAVDRNSRPAGECDFESAAKTETVDHGDGRNLQRFEPVDHRVRPADRGLDRLGVGGAAKFVDVGAGNKPGCLCGANDKARGPLTFQHRQHRVEFFDDIGRQRVGAGAFAVKQKPGNAVGVVAELEMAIG